MSYFSKLWNKWFGRKTSNSVSTQSTVSVSSGVGTPVTTPKRFKSEQRQSTSSRDQCNAYYDESHASVGVDPLTVAIVVNSLDNEPIQSVVENFTPSSHLAPYESNASGHSHSDSYSSSHADSGYNHVDQGSNNHDSGGYSNHDSVSSSYDSGSSGGSDGGSCGD